MSTTYDKEGYGYTLTSAQIPEGRNIGRAFEVGFTIYVWTAKENRTTGEALRRARGRYSSESSRKAFLKGWDAAAATTPIGLKVFPR